MVEISRVPDKLEVPVGQTAKGAELVIVTTDTGMYRVEYRGPGAAPAFTADVFTNLSFARRAVDLYRKANAGLIAKEAMRDRLASAPARRKAALELENGELKVETDDE